MQIESVAGMAFVDQQEVSDDGGGPLRKDAAVAAVATPCPGRLVQDLAPMVDTSAALGKRLAATAREAMRPFAGISSGKGAPPARPASRSTRTRY